MKPSTRTYIQRQAKEGLCYFCQHPAVLSTKRPNIGLPTTRCADHLARALAANKERRQKKNPLKQKITKNTEL